MIDASKPWVKRQIEVKDPSHGMTTEEVKRSLEEEGFNVEELLSRGKDWVRLCSTAARLKEALRQKEAALERAAEWISNATESCPSEMNFMCPFKLTAASSCERTTEEEERACWRLAFEAGEK